LHQNDSCTSNRRGFAERGRPVRLGGIVLLWLAGAVPARSEPQPTAAIWAPVRQLVTYMRLLPAGVAPAMFASRGVCIVENFAPFVFCGADSVRAWDSGVRTHFAEDGLSELSVRFGAAHDFSVVADRAYFSLPTTWRGRTHGRRFEEHGAWAFVLKREGDVWRVLGYGWGVTRYTESPR